MRLHQNPRPTQNYSSCGDSPSPPENTCTGLLHARRGHPSGYLVSSHITKHSHPEIGSATRQPNLTRSTATITQHTGRTSHRAALSQYHTFEVNERKIHRFAQEVGQKHATTHAPAPGERQGSDPLGPATRWNVLRIFSGAGSSVKANRQRNPYKTHHDESATRSLPTVKTNGSAEKHREALRKYRVDHAARASPITFLKQRTFFCRRRPPSLNHDRTQKLILRPLSTPDRIYRLCSNLLLHPLKTTPSGLYYNPKLNPCKKDHTT